MSCQSGNCQSASNNKYFGCPARISDGRTFTDYRPRCMVNEDIKRVNNLTNSYDYRQFMIHNAANLMKSNFEYAIQKASCQPCMDASPALNTQINCRVDTYGSQCSITDPRGLGLTNESVQNIRQGRAMLPVPVQMNFQNQ
jgi:hypothetical protein